MRILATHSEAIAHMVYFPMLVIIIMLAAWHACFDRVVPPAGLAVAIVLTMAHAILWPARMRCSAEKPRAKVLNQFHKALLKARHSEDKKDAAQLEDMIKYVSNLDDKGAFRPFSQQPWGPMYS